MSNHVKIDGKEVLVPITWDGLDKKQLLTIGKYWPLIYSQTDEEELSNAYYISKCFVLKSLLKVNGRTFAKLDLDQVAVAFYELMGFLNEAPDLNTQILPHFRLFGRKYIGPEAKLYSSSFNEMIVADTLYMKIAKGETNLLEELVATLYRPKMGLFEMDEAKKNKFWNGDKRKPFNEKRTKLLAKHFQKYLPVKYKWAIFYFYWGFRNTNVVVFENLFQEVKTNVKKTGNDYGWAGSLLELSGDKFGDFDKTSDTNWFTVFVEMSRRADHKSELERKRREQANLQKIKNRQANRGTKRK